jgi:hypothetical protein
MSDRLKQLLLLLIVALLSESFVSPGAWAQAVEFEPAFARYRYQNSQPFSGIIEFKQAPAFGTPATVQLELTAHASLDTVQVFRFVTLGLHPAEFTPVELTWDSPIDSGATKSFEVGFTPAWVGGYEILLSRYIARTWQELGRIMLTLDEDGNVICYGPLSKCGAAVVPLHPHRSADDLTIAFPQIPERKGQPANRDFSASFEFLSPPRKGDATLVEVKLECQRNLYREVQFVAEHSTNIKIDRMPESWGNSVGVNPDYRHFTDTLSFTLLRDGLTYLAFQVVGKHPHAKRGNHLTTSFTLYFVTSEQEGMLFLGDFDPIKRFGTADKSFLGSLTHLPEAGSSNYRTKHTLSKPDFRAEADSAASNSSDATKN